MVERQLRRRGITDKRVLAAMGEIPRELFIAEEERHRTYNDEPVAIGHGQTISQPYMTALMAQSLELRGAESVLEVGAGSGYHAAVLGALAARVVAIELIPELAGQARRNLEAAGRAGNVRIIAGDGSLGFAECAPYDAISVAAGAPGIPAALLEQLNDPGHLVIPVGDRDEQELHIVTKRAGALSTRTSTACRFVPLRGGEGWR
ncbi:MAG: protein-L-isoaspartate(D-aspartate) O-methyltransferase [Acidobacteria bacterium]|nr:protein-L-isoaspartate(D-aspartate) O-methyltransferase [Acidobacteriota bacterium]